MRLVCIGSLVSAILSKVGTGSDSDWVLLPLAAKTPVAIAFGTDRTYRAMLADC